MKEEVRREIMGLKEFMFLLRQCPDVAVEYKNASSSGRSRFLPELTMEYGIYPVDPYVMGLQTSYGRFIKDFEETGRFKFEEVDKLREFYLYGGVFAVNRPDYRGKSQDGLSVNLKSRKKHLDVLVFDHSKGTLVESARKVANTICEIGEYCLKTNTPVETYSHAWKDIGKPIRVHREIKFVGDRK